jgi:hypothetical protein
MKEIDDLKKISTNCDSFRGEYEFYDLKVKKEYGDDYFAELVQELNWSEDDIEILKFWYCLIFFDEKIKLRISSIEDKIETTINQPFSTTQKNEFLKNTISDCINLSLDFTKLGNQFQRSPLVNFESIAKEFIEKLPIFVRTSKFSGNALAEDMCNYALKLLNVDFSFSTNQFRTLSKENILAFACDSVSGSIIVLIDLIMSSYPNHINEKDFARILKNTEKGIEPPKIRRRGRPTKQTTDKTLKDIWKIEGSSYDDALKKLLNIQIPEEESGIAFVIQEEDKYRWQKKPFGSHAKYIQGFLLKCHEKGQINLDDNEISSRELQKIFENTFQLKVNEKSFVAKNILKVDRKYLFPFFERN